MKAPPANFQKAVEYWREKGKYKISDAIRDALEGTTAWTLTEDNVPCLYSTIYPSIRIYFYLDAEGNVFPSYQYPREL